ncbi:MAG: HD domain-containing protein [marine benthic group bacterium]|jgi:putative nucleotidyltransferase with HDIG domain|nr:HD domain-containing protein [Gemmatimonadota bacterium]MCL7962526.1 HD domain-containing protein [Candidatus Carthagonibacter metallireducens]MCL7981031.1 HD domain-containing protein [Gemmatimonadota bacterium]MCL7984622.1 HD domain-containing protein [Gemmatimonadota bacterium]MCL7990002.1 HD domain-containing protein [Gemmatimonadota bacterium]
MTSAAAFLNAVGKRLSAMSLYGAGHPSRDQAMDQVLEEMSMLLRENAFPVFNFLDGDVVYENCVMAELRQWEWSLRLAGVGVERLEISPGTSRSDLEAFLEEIHARLNLEDAGASVQEVSGQSSIRFGEVGIEGLSDLDPEPLTTATMEVNLREEAETIGWLHGEVMRTGEVPASEAVAVVKLLSLAMHSERDVVVPLVHLKQVDQYTTTHSINVSMLSMGLAEYLNFASVDVRAIGEAALLHDVGKTKIPLSVLNKPGKLTPDEWKLIQTHTTEGARILLASSGHMELAAIVAYEHHLDWQGEGYPEMTYPRQPHTASRLIQVCDIYDALRTRRPFRPPWPHDRAVEFIRSRSGEAMDPEFVDAFLSMIRQWEPRQIALDGESDPEDETRAEEAVDSSSVP